MATAHGHQGRGGDRGAIGLALGRGGWCATRDIPIRHLMPAEFESDGGRDQLIRSFEKHSFSDLPGAMRTTLLFASKSLDTGGGAPMLLSAFESAFGLGQVIGAFGMLYNTLSLVRNRLL